MALVLTGFSITLCLKSKKIVATVHKGASNAPGRMWDCLSVSTKNSSQRKTILCHCILQCVTLQW